MPLMRLAVNVLTDGTRSAAWPLLAIWLTIALPTTTASAFFATAAIETDTVVQAAVTAVVVVAVTFSRVVVAPPIRWRIWRYRVTENHLFLQRGLFVVRRTLIPLVRVQNVDTIQGPLARRFGLSEVVVATAASTTTIPALSDPVAEALRDRIADLARVARDDA